MDKQTAGSEFQVLFCTFSFKKKYKKFFSVPFLLRKGTNKNENVYFSFCHSATAISSQRLL